MSEGPWSNTGAGRNLQGVERAKVARAANDEAHKRADTDYSHDSIHHTLGKQPTQAAPGNHKHGVIDNNVGTDLPNIPHTRQWAQLITEGSLVTYRGRVSMNSAWGSQGFLTLPIPPAVGVFNTPWNEFSMLGQALFIRSGVAYVPAFVFLESMAGGGRASFLTVTPSGTVISGTSPHTWQAGDSIGWNIQYPRDI